MEENEFIQQMSSENLVIVEEWMDRYAGSIEQFAIQYGCAQEQAGKLAEETFHSLFTNLTNQTKEETVQVLLYRIALKKLDQIQQTEPLDDSFLRFEEDRQLHKELIYLERNAKISLIFSRFHAMNDREIAMLLGISEEAVKDARDQAIQQLSAGNDSIQITKQLEYLQLSYERIRPSFRKEQIFIEEQEIQETVKTRKPKKGMIPWMVGILILLSLIVTSVVTSEGYQKTSAEKYLERLTELFEDEMAARFAKIGLTESIEENTEGWNMFPYGKQARNEFNMMILRFERMLEETGTVDRKKVKEQYDAIIETLALPSEMVDQLVKHPLTDDREKSEDFMKAYFERYYEFQYAYQVLFFDNQETIEQATVNGQIELEKFLENRTTYSEALQQGLEGMMTQNIYPTVIPYWGTILPTFQKNEISAQIRASLHEELGGYVTVLESSPFINYPGLTYTFDESVEYLLDMEKTLLTSRLDESLYFSLNHTYAELLFELLGGSDPSLLVENDGKVKAEVQSAWKKIASQGEQSPSAVILKKIIGEMESSDWTESESQSRLTVHHIANAVTLAKEGQLQNFELTGIISTGQDLDIVSFPDAQFERQVEETYELFSAEHDSAVLQEVHPLVIFSMYVLANNREDPVTMWHLHKPEYASQTFEEYLNGWEKKKMDLRKIENLLFHKFEPHEGSIGLEQDHSTSYGTEMIEDQENIWRIKYYYHDSSFFE